MLTLTNHLEEKAMNQRTLIAAMLGGLTVFLWGFWARSVSATTPTKMPCWRR